MPDEIVQALDTSTRAHHPDSPSSLQSSEACPLFENQQNDSQASRDGTLQHKAVETRDVLLLDGNPDWEAAYTAAVAYEDRLVDEHVRRFGKTPEVIREKYLPVGTDYAGPRSAESALKIGVLDVGDWVGITGGFPDIIIVSEFFIDIVDWKFGKVPVTPTKDNLQGQSYEVAAFQAWPNVQQVRVHFVHPHQGWSAAEHERKYVHTFERADVPPQELRIRTVIARKKAAVRDLEQKGSWAAAQPRMDLCLWCARAGDCKKAHSVIIQGASKHPDFIVPEVVVGHQLSRPEQYKQAFRWANQVIMIANAVKHRCNQAVLTEDLDLGEDMKIVKRTEREIKSVRELVRVARQHGLRLADIVANMTISITKLEELIKAKAKRGLGAQYIRAFQQDALESGAVQMGQPIYFLQEARSPKEKLQPIIEIP